jgi:hypothetical protein
VPIATLEASSPDAVFAFLAERVSVRDRAHWTWKYRLDDPAAGARAFYHTAATGEVGGFIGLLPTTLHTRDAAAGAAWFVDWATGAGEGSVGAGVALLRHAERRTPILLTLVGSPDTRRILPRLRWRSTDRPGAWVLRLSARALAASGPVERRPWLRAAAPLARLYFRARRPPAAPYALREVDRFPREYDAVWEERRAEFAPLMDRSSAALNFMCADYPGGGYRRFLIVEGERAVGHLVLREDTADGGGADADGVRELTPGGAPGGPATARPALARGRIVDALWVRGRPGMAEWLVRSACWAFQRAGIDYIECTASVPDLEAALAACRFSRRRPVPIWYHRVPDGVPGPETWFITYLDCDRAYR